MREIKFRGIDSDRKWIYGSLIKVDSHKDYRGYEWEYGIHKPSIYDNTGHLNWNLDVKYVRTETVGQYTGLRDKNGREIYEGDILSVDFLSYKAEVKYHMDGFMAFRENYPSEPIYRVYKECVVIGNLHDNPELMDNK